MHHVLWFFGCRTDLRAVGREANYRTIVPVSARGPPRRFPPVDDLRAAFGYRVRELRERAGLTQEALAERADLDVTYVSGIERGRRNPGLNILGRLAKALRVPLPTLVADLREAPRRSIRRGRPRKRVVSSK